jgi:hypothetical protein
VPLCQSVRNAQLPLLHPRYVVVVFVWGAHTSEDSAACGDARPLGEEDGIHRREAIVKAVVAAQGARRCAARRERVPLPPTRERA